MGSHRVSVQVYKNLASINDLTSADAQAAFLDCCGSHTWADAMTNARPFRMLEDLYETAEKKWFALTPADWLEAFAAHPKIGSREKAPSQKERAGNWSAGEQAGVADAALTTRDELAEYNRLYQDKFGFIFIVCATGKTADEMLAICKARLGNSMETELRLAAIEQHKITEIRLNKLLEKD